MDNTIKRHADALVAVAIITILTVIESMNPTTPAQDNYTQAQQDSSSAPAVQHADADSLNHPLYDITPVMAAGLHR